MKKGRDILSNYGKDSGAGNVPRATSGGVTRARPVMAYQPPAGPIGISRVKVGLGGKNYGVCGTQGMHSDPTGESGGPTTYDSRGNKGTQR